MPELPEVETSRRGIEPWIVDRTIAGVTVRDRRLRWPVPRGIESKLRGGTVRSVGRRAKYLLINTDNGTAIVHLGMTGSVFDLVADGLEAVGELVKEYHRLSARLLLEADERTLQSLARVQHELEAADGWHWVSSLTREDVRGSACEVIWVEAFSVVQ